MLRGRVIEGGITTTEMKEKGNRSVHVSSEKSASSSKMGSSDSTEETGYRSGNGLSTNLEEEAVSDCFESKATQQGSGMQEEKAKQDEKGNLDQEVNKM